MKLVTEHISIYSVISHVRIKLYSSQLNEHQLSTGVRETHQCSYHYKMTKYTSHDSIPFLL